MTAHLWIVVAQPDADHYNRVIVPIVSDKPHVRDRTCPLKPGEHEFIKHESLVLYQKSDVVTSGTLKSWLQRGELQIRLFCDDDLVDRVRHGALMSPYTPRYVKEAINDCSWKPANATGGSSPQQRI
jgi:hypothetical protein